MTAFGMISRMSMDGGGGGRFFRGGGPQYASPGTTAFRLVKPSVEAPAPRPMPVEVVRDVAPPPPPPQPIEAPAPTPIDLPPILPAEVAPKPKPGFFDQELIPGVKNLYLVGGALGALLLVVVLARKK